MNEETITLENLNEALRKALEKLGVRELSDVQRRTFMPVQSGKDVLVHAAAASGKTYAYLLPLLQDLTPQGKGKHFPVVLVLVPTRELALQSARVCRDLLSTTEGIRTALLCGGEDMNAQVKAFSKGADIVFATPARLCDHLRRHTFKTKMLRTIVIDEADMMLTMGFENDIRTVCEAVNDVQKVLLSATLDEKTLTLCNDLLHDYRTIEVKEETVRVQKISVSARIVRNNQKLDALASLIRKKKDPVLVFCNKRKTADFVNEQLRKRGLISEAIHSEMDRKKRTEILALFRQKKLPVLCATDVLARGIDIGFLDRVILYDYPEEVSAVLHRTARSSRNMQASQAVFLLDPKEKYRIKEAGKILQTKINII